MEEIKLQVLLIEDDEIDYLGLKRAFNLIGVSCELDVAQTGEDGLDKLFSFASQSDRLPIVLLDINLPGQSGLETLELIRSSSLTQEVRVIVWSNIHNPEDLEKANELGIEGFVLKSAAGSSYVKAATMLQEYWRIDTQES